MMLFHIILCFYFTYSHMNSAGQCSAVILRVRVSDPATPGQLTQSSDLTAALHRQLSLPSLTLRVSDTNWLVIFNLYLLTDTVRSSVNVMSISVMILNVGNNMECVTLHCSSCLTHYFVNNTEYWILNTEGCSVQGEVQSTSFHILVSLFSIICNYLVFITVRVQGGVFDGV